MTRPKPVVLCILDGWGLREDKTANAPALADTPTYDRIMATCPHAQLITHGPDVGLPSGQMGNSEVGHTNIGAGRVVAMDLGQIDLAIETGSFFDEPALTDFIATLQGSGGTAHLMGVVSDGGVHGHVTTSSPRRAPLPRPGCRWRSTPSLMGATSRPARPATSSPPCCPNCRTAPASPR